MKKAKYAALLSVEMMIPGSHLGTFLGLCFAMGNRQRTVKSCSRLVASAGRQKELVLNRQHSALHLSCGLFQRFLVILVVDRRCTT